MVDRTRRAEVERALRGWLRTSLEVPDLDFAEPPSRLLGGNRTFVYAFRLAVAPAPYGGELVLRILRPPETGDVRLESALHDALLAQRFPVPGVLAFHEGKEPFGGAFQLLERVPGRPLLHGYDDPQLVGRGLLRQHLAELQGALLEPWPERLAALQARLHALDAAPIRDATARAGVAPGRLELGWRLDTLEASLRRRGIEALAPAFAWLRERLPGPDAPQVLCHGDLFANQVYWQGGAVCGVLDWSDACLAPPELDVGIVTAGLETLPLLPGRLQPLGAALLRRLSRRFRRAYARERPLDPERLRFAEAYRSVLTLASVLGRRWTLAEGDAAGAAPNPYDSPAGEVALLGRLDALTGLRLSPGGIP